jgi:hypothetical protein
MELAARVSALPDPSSMNMIQALREELMSQENRKPEVTLPQGRLGTPPEDREISTSLSGVAPIGRTFIQIVTAMMPLRS